LLNVLLQIANKLGLPAKIIRKTKIEPNNKQTELDWKYPGAYIRKNPSYNLLQGAQNVLNCPSLFGVLFGRECSYKGKPIYKCLGITALEYQDQERLSSA
jgi:hypothetical protein